MGCYMLPSVESQSDSDFEVRELRHRTRNSMHSVAALLRIQSRQAKGAEAQDALASAADRISAFERINDILDRSRLGTTTPRALLEALVREIHRAMIGTRGISIEVEACEHPVSSRLGATLGLVTNELVTNALKYAFPDDRNGTVLIRCVKEGASLVLDVQDDGIGASSIKPGLGLKLVGSLVSKADGSLEKLETGGTAWHVVLPLTPY